jgi:Pentapeptide repeats (9 copies)
MKLPNSPGAREGARPSWQPMPAWRWMLAAFAAVVITAVLVIIWLYAIASHARPGTDQANARLDAVRTGLAAGAGAGAAVGLMLAFRRQHHQEIATDLSDRDATERRITELYTKAVEQLGSDKAPVRLGGLYALERLAQGNPVQRQTIVNVVCAYLRMPFSPTAPVIKPESEATEAAEVPAGETEPKTERTGDTWKQERQVRLTAQRILGEHLRDDRLRDRHSTDPPTPRFWPGIRINLADATLIDINLQDGVVADSDFRGATFTGNVVLDTTTFTGDALFDGATFTGDASFSKTAFGGRAVFANATFSGGALFLRVTFSDNAGFGGATFNGGVRFDEANFNDSAWFTTAIFNQGAVFNRAAFHGGAWFDGATVKDAASFEGATFNGSARFDKATFNSDALFSGVTFSGEAGFSDATFNDLAGFTEAIFNSSARFSRATFNGDSSFDRVIFKDVAVFLMATFRGGEDSLSFGQSHVLSPSAGHVWPTGWRLGPDGNGEYTVVRASGDGRS